MALNPHTGPLKTCSGVQPVPRCEPSTYQPISQCNSNNNNNNNNNKIDDDDDDDYPDDEKKFK